MAIIMRKMSLLNFSKVTKAAENHLENIRESISCRCEDFLNRIGSLLTPELLEDVGSYCRCYVVASLKVLNFLENLLIV